MRVKETGLPGVLLIEPQVYGDDRGYFYESFKSDAYASEGLPGTFVQDNLSRSVRHTLRGLHLQNPFGQGKLVAALVGEVYDVAVDVRVGSPAFGRWVARHLSESNKHRLYIPPGFAHGFMVLSEYAVMSYKCTEYYHPEAEMSVAWGDPQIGIEWPVEGVPLLSPKDRDAPTLEELTGGRLPRFSDQTVSL